MCKKSKNSNRKKGFTLVELLVAMAVFSIIALATVAAFGSGMQSQRKAREIQRNVAAAKTALDLMAKTMRMSKDLENPNEYLIYMENTSQGQCISYHFIGNNLKMAQKGNGSGCDPGGYSVYTTLISGATGKFKITTTDDVSPKRMGKATILVEIGDDSLQTSVSFRDYEGIVQ